MLLNYVKIAYRNIIKHKSYSFINILGMSIGIAGFLLIFAYVEYEIGFDTFHDQPQNIYRLITDVSLRDGGEMNTCLTSSQMYNFLKEDFPEIAAVTRINPSGEMLFTYKEMKIYEESFTYVDSTFFDVFDFTPVWGRREDFLSNGKSLVLSAKIAGKYFGIQNPIGEIITIDNKDDYIVTGVIEDIPANSHINFDIIAHNSGERSFNIQNWGALSLYTYVRLTSASKAAEIVAGFDDFKMKHMGEPLGGLFKFDLQPMLDIHLYSDREHDISKRNDIEQIYIFSIIAILLVFIASINFMNLSTARSTLRSLEIGIRKVLGSTRKRLVIQHLCESFLLISVSVVFAVALFYLSLPYLNEIGGVEIESNLVKQIPILIVLVIVVGLFAGSYPAFLLSGFEPIKALKGKGNSLRAGNFLRKGLVIFQFTVAVGLLICTLFVYQQMNFIRDCNLGYSDEQVLVVPFRDELALGRREILKNSILQKSGIQEITMSSGLPGYGFQQRAYNIPDSAGGAFIFHTVSVDENYLKTLKMKLVEGRNFSERFPTDRTTSFIINQAAANKLGWNDPLGKQLSWLGDRSRNDTANYTAKAIGVVEDFHFQSMFEKIEPLVIRFDESATRIMAIKMNGKNTFESVNSIKGIWESTCPETPFESYFLDESFDELYKSEQRLGSLFFVFTSLSIFISCLGLFGLSAFTVQNRRKEIGVRKVLGAKVSTIVLRLSKEFSLWVMLANLIAWPVSYFIMKDWLDKFAYKIDLQLTPFILAAVLAFLIANFVLSFQTVKAALVNPVDSLKDE